VPPITSYRLRRLGYDEMSRLANKSAASIDDDPVGITEEAALEWLRQEYGLSIGAAIRQLQEAWNSGNVRGWDNLAEIGQHGEMVLRDGKPVQVPPRIGQLIPDRLVHDHRLHADDLRWQIEQQLGKPATATPVTPPRPSRGPVPGKTERPLAGRSAAHVPAASRALRTTPPAAPRKAALPRR
jgi:hypothetical protein